MAGAENTIQIQVQFLIGVDDNGVPIKLQGDEKLKITPVVYKNNNIGTLSNPISMIAIKHNLVNLLKETAEQKKFFYSDSGFEGMISGSNYARKIDDIKLEDRKICSSSMFFEMMYKICGRDIILADKSNKNFINICGITIKLVEKDVGLDEEAPSATTDYGKNAYLTGKLCKALSLLNPNIFGQGNGTSIPDNPTQGINSYQRRYLHYFPTFGTNSGKPYYAINVFILLTIYDIALAVNYKPIGFANLYQEWKNGTLYKNTNSINQNALGSLIDTFEEKIKTSIKCKTEGDLKADYLKEEDFDKLNSKTSLPVAEDDSINYNKVFKVEIGESNDQEMIILKVLKQLDLEYLAEPKNLLRITTSDAVLKKDAIKQGGRVVEDAVPPIPSFNYAMGEMTKPEGDYIILSPFVWIYYRIKEIVCNSMGITNHSDITDDNKKTHTLLLARLIILKVVFAYINVIVEQGKGIVTSLEHLKYFFLYNTNKQEGLYGYNFKQIDPKARFYHRQDKAPLDATTWKSNYKDSPGFSGTDAYAHIKGDGYDTNDNFYKVDLLSQTSIYHRPVYLKDLDKYILERVNKGSINRVRMLRNLIYFGQQCSLDGSGNFPESSDTSQCAFITGAANITTCDSKDIFDLYKSKPTSQIKAIYPYINALVQKKRSDEADYKKNQQEYEQFLSLNIVPDGPKGDKLNTYIMMAHIMRGVFQKDGYVDLTDRGKYSDATIATLEFAQSIKSDVGVCKPPSQVISYNRYNPTFEVSTDSCIDFYKIESKFMENLDILLKKTTDSVKFGGSIGPMTCSYRVVTEPDFENMYKVLRLVDTKKFSNNKFYGNINNYLKILKRDGSIKSKKNIMNIANKLRSKRRRNSKSPSRLLIRHYKR